MTRLSAILFTLFSIFITFSLLYSQEIGDVQFELTRSEDFTKSINKWLFPTEESIISIDKKQITRRSDSGANHFTLAEDALKVIFSKGSNYFGIVRLNRVPEGSSENRKLRIEVYTANGEKLYEIQRNYYYDDSLPLVAISEPDGSLIMGQNTSGEIRFYNPNGFLLRKVRLFDDAEYDLERVLQIDLSKDGTSVAIVAGKRGASPAGSNAPNPSAEPHLFLFYLNGMELLRKPLADFNTSATAISDDGQYIAANSYTVAIKGDITKRTIIFDNSGKEIGEVNLLFKRAGFSPDSKFLILADNNAAKVFNLTTGKISWSYTISKREGKITAVDISNNGEISALLVAKSKFGDGTFMFTNPRLKILNNSGNLLQELEMSGQEFEKPALNLWDDSKKIFIGFRKTYQIYQVK
jgi:WD40 repeat protein